MTHEEILVSWRDTSTRQALVDYVARVTGDGPERVEPDDRVATFDNDGTLWCEKPLPIQLAYVLERMARMADDDPSLRDQQPWKAAHERDLAWLGGVVARHYEGDDTDVRVLLRGVVSAMARLSVDQYAVQAADFVGTRSHPSLGITYAECAYLPMLELLRYLEAHEFSVFVASAGDRDFMRPLADDLYGLPPERVIGSSNAIAYDAEADELVYLAEPDVFDDGPVKPVRIWSRVGRRPLVAGGNANGDVPMLAFAGGERAALRLLVRHDDAEREFEYVRGSEAALERAEQEGWTVVSMANDWETVFG